MFECPPQGLCEHQPACCRVRATGTKDVVTASAFLRQCSRPAVKALLKQSEPRLYLEGDALFEEVSNPGMCCLKACPASLKGI